MGCRSSVHVFRRCALACAAVLLLGCSQGHSTKAFEEAAATASPQGGNAQSSGNSGSAGSASTGFVNGPDLQGGAGAAGTSDPTTVTTAGMGAAASVDAGTADADTDAQALFGPCPPSFECLEDPLLHALHACLKSGALPTPVSCMTDAECVAAGLPKGICIVEEETGLTGCLQLCSP